MSQPLGLIVPLQDPTPFSPFSPTEWSSAFARMKQAGYTAIELAVTDPERIDHEEVMNALRRENLCLLSLTTGQAAVKEGLSLSSPDTDIRKRTVERIQAHMRFAKPTLAVVIVGLLRGVDGDIGLLIESLRECTAYDTAVKIALEPLNRYESRLVNTAAEGLEVVKWVGAENLGLLLDTFHANIEEREISQAFRDVGERLFHVHLADSNRWSPGCGHLNFEEVWKALAAINYQGGLVIEAFPLPSEEEFFSSAEAVRARWDFERGKYVD